MNFDIRNVDFESNEWDVKRAIASILHTEAVFRPAEPGERQINFEVELNKRPMGIRNDGTGILTLPSRETELLMNNTAGQVGNTFMKWYRKEGNRIKVGGKRNTLKFYPSRTPPRRDLLTTLDKTPYLNPDIEEELQEKKRLLDVSIRVDKVQMGLFYRPAPGQNRNFSIEWESHFVEKSLGWLGWEYEHKLIRVRLGDPMIEQTGHNIVIKFSNIRKLAISHDFGNPALCFDLITPPMFEEEDFNRPLTGDEKQDSRKFRRRTGSIHPGHARVAPYCHHLRLILYRGEDLDDFVTLCKVAGLQRPINVAIDAYKHGYCSSERLHLVNIWLRSLSWRVAFQLEALVHNALISTEDLLTTLYDPINKLYREHENLASEVLRYFTEALQSLSPNETPLACFRRTVTRKLSLVQAEIPAGMFLCHHVCFAPTRLLLEGPYVIQSNRVIREWSNYQDHFIRVDFRDEDRLQYRWDREVDGRTFLDERVGGTLKNGFELAGRHFEFLAYSSSALREHAVWFLNPFQHPEHGWVTAELIRRTLGDFRGVIHQPSKYAARIAQAFTATDPSVRIRRDQWEEVDDLYEDVDPKSRNKPGLFTDGVGTISIELSDMIWQTLCAARRDGGKHAVKPSAYQIRFLGYKGVVAVDVQLPGIFMRLRPSMNKFKGREDEFAEIEIARAFSKPNTSYLNRSMVMIMEDRGVKKDSFMTLQDAAVADARTIDDSLLKFKQVLKSHQLGGSYRLDSLVYHIMNIGLDIGPGNPEQRIENSFWSRLRHFAMTHVLRDIKHGARIPIPKSFLLVGVADEGPAYAGKPGFEKLFTLQPGKIYGKQPDDPEPQWLKGSCTISRSPVVHPGDIQRVFAIGKPPEDQICLFRHLKNVVVLPCTGARSLASCLGGGDLDGDQYDVIFHSTLLPTEQIGPAAYPPGNTRANPDNRPSTVDDICDFIVEYINSDVLGLLSDRHLTIADQSKFGTSDEKCLKLAELCSQAVDYPKNGIPVDIERSPRFLIRYKPDWHAAEVAAPRRTDYYDSERALGHLYRAIQLEGPEMASQVTPAPPKAPLTDAITLTLKPLVLQKLHDQLETQNHLSGIKRLFQAYVDELSYICLTHSLTTTNEVRLTEEEVVVGTILAKCSQRRWRKDKMHRMRTHSLVLVQDTQRQLIKHLDTATRAEICVGITKAWATWEFSLQHAVMFGANSFGLIALVTVFDCLDKLNDLDSPTSSEAFHAIKKACYTVTCQVCDNEIARRVSSPASTMGKSTTTDRSRQKRASAPTRFVNENENDDEFSDVIQDEGEDDNEREDGSDMLHILEALQKRKSKKKQTTGTKLGTLETQKAILYAEARQFALDTTREGSAYLDSALNRMSAYAKQPIAAGKHVQDFAGVYTACDASVKSLLALYPALLQGLGPRRAQEMEEASGMALEHPKMREESRRMLMKRARVEMQEGVENQRLATDAKEMIRRYKSLLLS
ncbi:hypothetical protein HWV62_39639 [Athelia sp. TMB]|nr:hypothetical protein HWV62_39639 [Athelia sp. TMB]